MTAFDDTRREPSFSAFRPLDEPPARRRRPSVAPAVVALALALALGAAGWWWSSREPAPAGENRPATAAAPDASPAGDAAAKAPPPELLPAEPGKLVRAEGVTDALVQLLGRDAVLRFLETTDFPRKAVATLDNLGREHAPVTAWPVLPAPGRFLAAGTGGAQVIATENAMRYWPFVGFVDAIDPAQAVDLYRRLYPLLQEAYRDLGFGTRPLHARVLEVIDLLLATPEPAGPIEISLTEVKGPIVSAQPWTRYEYADPRFEKLTSGQKMLLRMGPDNRKVLKAKLERFRQELLLASSPARR